MTEIEIKPTAFLIMALMEFRQANPLGLKHATRVAKAVEMLAAEALQKATESPITASPTTVSPSGAVAEYMRRETQASSPSAPTTTESGPVEPNSGCVHQWRPISFQEDYSQSFKVSPKTYREWSLFDWCQECGALQLYGRILVPAATTTPSTSQSQDRPSSVGTSGTTAPSLSKESGERQDLRKRCAALGHPFSRCYCGDVGVGSSTL